MSLVVGPPAGERREKRVVDVDHRRSEFLQEIGGEDLHVSREHDQLHAPFAQECELLRLGLRLGRRGHRDVNEAEAVTRGHGREVRVIAHDRHHVARKIPRLPAQHQIVKAMVRL